MSQTGFTLKRFPLPVLASLVAFVALLLEVHEIGRSPYIVKNHIYTKIGLEAISGIALLIAFDFFVLAKGAEFSKRLGLYLLGFCILGMHFYSITPGMFDSESIFISRYLIFFVCFHLLVSCATFYHKDEIGSFWNYNWFLFLQFAKSLGFSLSLFIGLGSAVWAVDNLFGMHFEGVYYVDLAAFIFLVFNTIFFLGNIPREFSVFKVEIDYKKSIRIFVQYVMMPVTLLYMGILYLYFFKVLMEQRIPNGWICIPILIFAILGVFTYLLIYPIRQQTQNRLFYNYARFFFYSLLPLLTMYFISIIQRIKPYGITEDRYLVLILGIWMLTMSVYIILSKRDNIIIIPASLLALLAVSAIGPWGMFQLSGRNQLLRLEKILTRNKLLVSNRLIHDPVASIPEADAQSIQSILQYLKKRGELNRLYSWLTEEDKKFLKDAIDGNELQNLNALFNAERDGIGNDGFTTIDLHADRLFFENNPTRIQAGKALLRLSLSTEYSFRDSSTDIHFDSGNRLTILHRGDTLISENLSEKVNQLVQIGIRADSLNRIGERSDNVIRFFREGYYEFTLPADSMILQTGNGHQLMLNNLHAIQDSRSTTMESAEAYLLIDVVEPPKK